MRRRGTAVLLGFSLAFGYVAGAALSPASAHDGCSFTGSSPTVVKGDEHANLCSGGTGFDSMYGYARGDNLGGGSGRDYIRGAHGNDELWDTAGSDDVDRTCDGDGLDQINVLDGDLEDAMYFVDGDGHADTGQDDCIACSRFSYTAANGCPF